MQLAMGPELASSGPVQTVHDAMCINGCRTVTGLLQDCYRYAMVGCISET
jgi:hypothetical protein